MIFRRGENRQYWASMVQRFSGVLLALFLPAHFLVLGLALEGEAKLDGFLRWTEQPLVKLAEAGLVVLLTVHLLGGLRVLMIEFLPWQAWQERLVSFSGGIAVAVGLLFLVGAF